LAPNIFGRKEVHLIESVKVTADVHLHLT